MPPSHKDILRRTIDALEASLRRYPDNGKILLQLALAYSQIGRFDRDALRIYQQAAVLNPADIKVQKALSNAFLIGQTGQLLRDLPSLQQLDPASLQQNIESLMRLAREFPDSPQIHKSLGDLQLARGDDRESVQHYRCALALGFTDLAALCDNYESVRQLRPFTARLAVFFADIFQRMGNDEAAGRIYQEALDKKYADTALLESFIGFLKGRLEHFRERDEDAAFRYYRQMISVFLLMGRTADAIQMARQAPPHRIVQDSRLAKELSRRLVAVEDFRQAFEFLSRLPLDEESKALLNEMAGLLEKRGELDTAAYVLQFINENDELARESRQLFNKNQKPTPEEDLHIEVETELQMAELHWKNRRWANAFERYLRVLELGYQDYRSLLEPLDLVISRLTEIKPEQLIFLANFFGDKRDWRRCLDFSLRSLAEDHGNTAMSQRVLQSCERILLEDSENHAVRLMHGDELLRIGNIERAMQEFRKCAEIPEFKMKAGRRLALANFRAGDLLGAFDKYRALPVLEAEDLERIYDLALAFGQSEQYREAFEAVKLIREYDPKFRDVETRFADFEERMNQSNIGFIIDPKMRELIGDHSIGRYKYIAKIGSGGMGVVHKVLDMKSNTIVAMKILREGLSSSGKAIDRFFREARIAATLRHKNIVNILDYNISNNYGQSYIAMEFVDGPTLRELVEKKFSQTVDISRDDVLEALEWTSQLCDALDATHKKGIIHRDIKPDNIMLAPHGVIKITDFGIVHIEEATFTPTGALIGTPRYMSPEQVHGGRIDARSDIYAVGIIMYELLIGSPPFISGDISYQQVNVLPTPPREICPAIPAAVDRMIMRCLEKAPPDRYQSTLELKHDIDETFVRLGGDPRRRLPSAAQAATPPANPSPPPASTPRKPVSPHVDTVDNEDSIETPSAFLKKNRAAVETREILPHAMELDSEFDV